MKNLYCYDNEIIKWIYGDNLYCLHIQYDDEADNNPRWWDDHDSVMACFHPRYCLGDKIDAITPEEFWNDMVGDMCRPGEVLDALENMKLEDTCAERYQDMETDEYYYGLFTIDDSTGEKISGDTIADGFNNENEMLAYVYGDLSIRDCQILLNDYIVWLPLWLHDHSGLSMDCDTRFRDMWDDSNVGWIITAIPDGSDSSKNAAEQIMRDEVKTYSDYLSGENYRYTLYQDVHGEWKEIDTAGGFIGCDVLQNGIAYSAGNGIESALLNDDCRIGDAEKVVTVTWNFDKC